MHFTSTILLFILLPRRYIISLMLLDRKILCITPLFFHSTALHVFYSLSLFIYFFLYIFSLCRSLSTYIRVNETLYAKSRLNLAYIILPIFHSEKDGSSCGISPFPSSFDASGFVRRAGALRNVCILYHRSSRAFFV